jgi:hypothetical protein
MSEPITRREALQHIGTAGAGVVLAGGIIRGQSTDITIAGKPVEIVVSPLSPATVRIQVLPIEGDRPVAVPNDGALVQQDPGKPAGRSRSAGAFAGDRRQPDRSVR